MSPRIRGSRSHPSTETTPPATRQNHAALASTAPASSCFRSATRRAVSASVPTFTALRLPPKSHTMMSDGRSAACPFDDSGHGRCEKKTTSISLTTLCDSIAKTVGSARPRIAR